MDTPAMLVTLIILLNCEAVYSLLTYGAGNVEGVGIKKYNRAKASGLHVSGISEYNARFQQQSGYSKNPNICMRLQNNRTYDQESRNQLVMIFVCPFEATDPDKARYCCGPKLEEYCCTYWQSKKSVSGVLEGMAVIASILLVIIVIGINLKRSFQDRCCKKEPTTTIITWDKAAVPL